MKEIKLKKIKPNTAIHCTDKEQIEYLVKNKIVDVWALEKGVPVWLASYKDNRIHSWMPEHDGKQTGEEYYKSVGLICIEFSDLILPELSTEEVVEWVVNNYYKDDWEKCFGKGYALDGLIDNFDTKEFIDRIANYIYEHKKKKTETEWVGLCRIIQTHENGTKKCVYEEEIKPDEDLPYGSEKPEAERIFKKYIAEHDGKFIAVIEPVLKVRE